MTRTIARIFAALILTAPHGSWHAAAETTPTPFETAANTPRGQLSNPYTDLAAVAKEGYRIYLSHDCNGCHGGGGGGGMAAPLTNEIWIYGAADDTLFRVIALGTGALSPGNAFAKQGFKRKGSGTSSVLCRRSAKFSKPTTISGRSSPGSGSSIASGIQPRVERRVTAYSVDMP